MLYGTWDTLVDWSESASDAFQAAVEVISGFVGALLLVFLLASLASMVVPLVLLLALLCLACG